MDLQRAADLLARDDVELSLNDVADGRWLVAVRETKADRNGFHRQHCGRFVYKDATRDRNRSHQ